jgi:hypothetical protein
MMENSRMICHMEKVERSLKNKVSMKVNSNVVSRMEKELWSFSTELSIKVILLRIILMVSGYLLIKVINMMVIGRRVWSMEKESILFRMVADMKGSTMKIRNMVTESTTQTKARSSEGSGLRESLSRLKLNNFFIENL